VTAVESKVKVDAKSFAQAVAAVVLFSSKRSGLTITTHVRLVARGGLLHVQAVNDSAEGSRTISAEGECDVCLPAKTLELAAKTMQGSTVEIVLNDKDGATIGSGRAKVRLPGIDAQDFPRPRMWPEGAEPVFVNRTDFVSMVSGVAEACSTDQHRSALMGVMLQRDGDDLIAAATDSHRLHVARALLGSSGISGLMPAAFLRSVEGLPSDDIEICVHNGTWMARCSGAQVANSGLAGTYPNWERVVPNDPPLQATVSREGLIDTVRRVAVAIDAESSKIAIDPSEPGGISVLASGSERGDAEDFIEAGTHGGGKFAVNWKYLVAALGTLDGETVEIRYDAPSRPIVFRGEGPNFAVIMPMAL
jgi:DNA polymerase-3 subunit beta